MSIPDLQAGPQTNNAFRFNGSSLSSASNIGNIKKVKNVYTSPIGPTISGIGGKGLDDPSWSPEADKKAAAYYKSLKNGGNIYVSVLKSWEIATPVCGLVRNDNFYFSATNTNLPSHAPLRPSAAVTRIPRLSR